MNTHHTLIADFEKHFVETGLFNSFKIVVLQINQNEPTEEFSIKYFNESKQFVETVKVYRERTKTEIVEEV